MKHNYSRKQTLFFGFSYLSALLLSACSGSATESIDLRVDQNSKAFTKLNSEKISGNQQYSQLNFNSTFGLLAINQQKQLQQFKNNTWNKLVDGVHPTSPISADRGRLSFVDENQKYAILYNQTKVSSTYTASLFAPAVHLGGANVVIAKATNNKYNLMRVNFGSSIGLDNANSKNHFNEYSSPRQLDLYGNSHSNGHILVFGNPVNSVNTDKDVAQFKTLFYIERHNMDDINFAKPLTLTPDNLVFSTGTYQVLNFNNKNYVVATTLDAPKNQSLINLIGIENNALKIFKTSVPVTGLNSWINPFVVNNEIYATKSTDSDTGSLYKYSLPDLVETKISSGFDLGQNQTTAIGLYGVLNNNLFARATDHKSLKMINLVGSNTILEETFTSDINQIVTGNNSLFVRLTDGSVYEVKPE
ncbi:hypothetical protein J2Z62_000678 [Mycoplasmoides fastidiosum]|uniref:Lipoprotein n=1 Tax=Mycoplasmoides fastidiosum TaxID=92758 RepID=A0ABU0LZW8_9BACT|nr:hypothetical protein [Mycoplasmoides fastidiosum]MDQ0514240.1 hypothetical protein [Mycoplasmoides fastidiosum]UUD37352.1 hypothetical protein NPA10_02085 [Mycoplasmoides fastidiosum]